MIEIGINGAVKNYGFKNILNGASLEIMTGERVGLVGRNGSGKSTLLKIISGEENLNEGSISIRRGAAIGYLEQIPRLFDAETATRQVLWEAFAPQLALERRMRELEGQMAAETDTDRLSRWMDAYEEAQNAFSALDGYSMEENFNRVVSGFRLGELLDRPFNVLSGGQKTVVKLACTILKQPDILLLDEPTNHLDVKTLEWFEGFLAKYRGTVLIVSHDRYFLDKVVTKTVLLDGGTCASFQGNYSFSQREQERLLLLEFEQYKTQQKQLDAMRAAIKRYREWGSQGDNPKFFRKANELEKRLEKLELLERPQLEKPRIPLRFTGGRTGREVLRLRDYSLKLAGLPLLENVDLTLYEKERVCLMGDNGTGKTSLLLTVLGESQCYTGRIDLNPGVKIGYIPQEIRFVQEDGTLLDAFRRECPSTEGEARNLLAKFCFCGEQVYKRAKSLSGGEKVLLKLVILVQRQVNFLVLDEPTNHIDLETREILEEALLDFPGTILFVSHDRYFINRLANRIFEIRGRGIQSFYGDYDSYREAGRNAT